MTKTRRLRMALAASASLHIVARVGSAVPSRSLNSCCRLIPAFWARAVCFTPHFLRYVSSRVMASPFRSEVRLPAGALLCFPSHPRQGCALEAGSLHGDLLKVRLSETAEEPSFEEQGERPRLLVLR